MKLLIASDLHGSFARASALPGLMDRHQPDALVLLGDILYHGPRNPFPEGYDPAGTAECLNGLRDRIIAIRGNCDSEVDEFVLAFALAPRFAWLFAEGARIQAAHGHLHDMKDLAASANLVPGDAFLSGHTHVPTACLKDGIHTWNPGSMALPKENFPPSYGLFAEGRFSVLSLDGGCLMEDTL